VLSGIQILKILISRIVRYCPDLCVEPKGNSRQVKFSCSLVCEIREEK